MLPTLQSPTPVSALFSCEAGFKVRCTQAPSRGAPALGSAAPGASLASFLGQGVEMSICQEPVTYSVLWGPHSHSGKKHPFLRRRWDSPRLRQWPGAGSQTTRPRAPLGVQAASVGDEMRHQAAGSAWPALCSFSRLLRAPRPWGP